MRDEVALLCYLSRGGFGYTEVIDMTVLDRKFYLRKLTDFKNAEAQAVEDAYKKK